jgi:hypothetical protein
MGYYKSQIVEQTDFLDTYTVVRRSKETILIDRIYQAVTSVTEDYDDLMCTLSHVTDLCEDYFLAEDDPDPYADSEWTGAR